MGAAFAEKFTATVIQNGASYSSPNMAFTVTQHVQGEGADKITYYVADIYLREIRYLQAGFAKNAYGKGVEEPFLDLVKNCGAVLAVSGDYYGRHSGPVIRNGVLYRDATGSGDVCVIYKDGTMKTFERGKFSADTEMKNGAWQAWCFGPSLLSEDGKAKTRFNSSLTPKHPRCAIGYYEPGHYALVLVDGRQDNYSSGMTLRELSSLFETLGCTVAYNLDGGRSAQMAYENRYVNHPYRNGRDVSDIIFLSEVPAQ
jgi:exopolysaccharide biosynthesis protein